MGSMDPQGPAAESMADLWWLMLWLGVAVFVVFAVLLAIGALRRPDEDQPPTSERLGRWILGWGAVGPAIVIFAVFVATVATMRATPNEAPDDALVVEIVGHQWWYEVRYPEQDVTTTDELRIPTGRPVALQLTSSDVIHSFWVPELAGKLDMLPDGINTLVLQADVPGEHVSRCAEFCGLEHTSMQLRVVAVPAEQFEEWLDSREQVTADAGGNAR